MASVGRPRGFGSDTPIGVGSGSGVATLDLRSSHLLVEHWR